MPTATVNQIALHFLQIGTGPDVVMVHGLAANLAFWNLAIAPALAQSFRVTTYDLRGHGRSDMPPSGYTMRDMVGDLHPQISHSALLLAENTSRPPLYA